MTTPINERLGMLHAILIRLNEGGYVGWGGVEQAELEILSLFREMVEEARPGYNADSKDGRDEGLDEYHTNLLQQLGEKE